MQFQIKGKKTVWRTKNNRNDKIKNSNKIKLGNKNIRDNYLVFDLNSKKVTDFNYAMGKINIVHLA